MNWPNQRYDTWRMRWALNAIRALRRGAMPTPAMLDALRRGCDGNVATPSTEELLDVARHVIETQGPILEYGCGVTTLLLAALVAPREIEVWTVERDGARHMRVARMLSAHGLSVRWCRVLMERSAIVWSDPAIDAMPDAFSLLVAVSEEPDGLSGRDRLPPALRSRLGRTAMALPATGTVSPSTSEIAAGLIA